MNICCTGSGLFPWDAVGVVGMVRDRSSSYSLGR